MALWKLQTVAKERLDFLHGNVDTGGTIELRSDVAFCFRTFHARIVDLVRGAWVRYVRQQNLDILGDAADLSSFLFGSERTALSMVQPALMKIQHSQCFYCKATLTPQLPRRSFCSLCALSRGSRSQFRSSSQLLQCSKARAVARHNSLGQN